jgi:hypothetical protein
MKRITLLILGSIFILTVQAQNAVLLESAGVTSAFNGVSPFEEAYAAAVNGDIIYLPGGTLVPPAIIDKSLTKYGVGHYPAATNATQSTFLSNQLVVNENTDGLRIEGVEVNGRVLVPADNQVNNLSLVRCKFKGLSFDNSSTTSPSDNLLVRDGKWSSTVSEEFLKVAFSLDDHLIAHYPFDGNANDKSDFLHHGSIVEATVVSDRFGNPEGALYFDGSNDHVIVPDINHLDIEEGMAFSVSLWLKHDGSNRGEYFLSKYNGSPGSTGAYAFGTGTYGDAYSWFYCVGQGGIENRGSIDLNTSSWHHFVAVYNPGEAVTLYIDGQLDISNPIVLNGSTNNSLDLHIGCGANKAQYYQGSLDDIRMYNKALTLEEINGLFNEVPTETRIIPLKAIKFYPNPVRDVLTLEGCENSSVELFDMSGKPVSLKKINQERDLIDLGGYSNGIYILRVVDGSGKVNVFKVIKE